MARSKMKKARPFEKLMQVLLHGNPVSKEDIADLLGWKAARGSKVKGPKIYNISSYIWDIKNIPQVDGRSIVVRSIRDGKKVTAYQIVNVDDAKKYLENRGIIVPEKILPVEAVEGGAKICLPEANGAVEVVKKKKSGKKVAKKEAA